MELSIVKAFEQYINEKLEQVIISNSTDSERIKKVKIRPVLIKGEILFQITSYCGQKVLHRNATRDEVLQELENWFTGLFKQAQISTKDSTVTILISKKGKTTVKVKSKNVDQIQWDPLKPMEIASHNRVKQYIIKEGVGVPFLVDLGIMTSEGKIVKSKYDKYKQINRFLEFIEDVLPNLEKTKKFLLLILVAVNHI